HFPVSALFLDLVEVDPRACKGIFLSFSSRRRHTRCYRDWSSDVCSSDLQILMGHGRCAKIWPQLRLTRAWSRRAEARGSCRSLEIGRASCRERVLIWVGGGCVETLVCSVGV